MLDHELHCSVISYSRGRCTRCLSRWSKGFWVLWLRCVEVCMFGMQRKPCCWRASMPRSAGPCRDARAGVPTRADAQYSWGMGPGPQMRCHAPTASITHTHTQLISFTNPVCNSRSRRSFIDQRIGVLSAFGQHHIRFPSRMKAAQECLAAQNPRRCAGRQRSSRNGPGWSSAQARGGGGVEVATIRAPGVRSRGLARIVFVVHSVAVGAGVAVRGAHVVVRRCLSGLPSWRSPLLGFGSFALAAPLRKLWTLPDRIQYAAMMHVLRCAHCNLA